MENLRVTRIVAWDNFDIEFVNEGHVLVTTVVSKESLNRYGHAHGGYLFTLCDEVSGLTALSAGVDSVTIQSNINYLTGADQGEKLWIEGQIIHNGRRSKVIDVVIKNSHMAVVAKGTFTMFVTGQDKEE